MRKPIRLLVITAALALSPLSLAAQQPAPPTGNRPQSGFRGPQPDMLSPGPGPVQLLLTNRVVLGLTTEQVQKLQEIDRKMEELNRPYVAQLFEIRRQLPRGRPGIDFTSAQRDTFQAKMRTAAPLLERINQNNFQAMREVGEVLTDQQEAKVKELIQKERRQDGGRNSRGRPDDRRD